MDGGLGIVLVHLSVSSSAYGSRVRPTFQSWSVYILEF